MSGTQRLQKKQSTDNGAAPIAKQSPVATNLIGKQGRMNCRCFPQDRVIEGKNQTRVFEDKQGIKRYVTEIVGEQVLMLDKKES
ncbi:MAG: single-stranded DNA-binding protein [Bacteroidia bacterium]|nr:single-stranded DNA-binding protein [Bacteroidia bacterium]